MLAIWVIHNDSKYTDGDTRYRILFEPGDIFTTTNVNDDIIDDCEEHNNKISYYGTNTTNQVSVW